MDGWSWLNLLSKGTNLFQLTYRFLLAVPRSVKWVRVEAEGSVVRPPVFKTSEVLLSRGQDLKR